MKSIKVKEIMVPLNEYATVDEDATLHEALLALEDAQQRFAQNRYKHRAILVFDRNRDIVGKLSQLDVIRGLETGYKKIGDLKGVSRSGFSPEFIKSLIEQYSLWQRPLDEICRKAGRIKIKDIMYTPTEREYVEEEASLDEAIHQLVMGYHQSLLVTRRGKIVGILRLTDVFTEICNVIKETCQV
jgi:CBS domain-containing protein